jgi:hypothetical protein
MDENRLFPGLERLVFGEHRCNGLGGNRSSHKRRELAAVMDVRYLETDDQPEAETGDTD